MSNIAKILAFSTSREVGGKYPYKGKKKVGHTKIAYTQIHRGNVYKKGTCVDQNNISKLDQPITSG